MSKNHTARLQALRGALEKSGFDGVVVPSADEYQGEYVPPCAARLAWLTGFEGSSGTAVVLFRKAALFVPGLYLVQAEAQIDPALFEIVNGAKTPAGEWIAANAPEGARIGYDPRLHTAQEIEGYREALAGKGVRLEPMEKNPVDLLWTDRPAAPASVVEFFPEEVSGRSAAEKCAAAAENLRKKNAAAFVFTMPDSIAWLLNIRGRDLPHVPVALSYAILDAQSARVSWFIAPSRVPQAARQALGERVSLHDPSGFPAALKGLGASAKAANRPVAFDLRTAPVPLRDLVKGAGAEIKDMQDPCIQPRACKTPSEQAAMIETHRRDGLAVVRALAWISREAGRGTLTELDVAAKFLECRAMDPAFRGTSFDTIAAFNANAAMPHYRPTPKTNARIVPPGVLLIDSGGQYCAGSVAGTTDITRTVAVGDVPDDIRRNNTLALKGHIAFARIVFPEGTTGAQIDGLTRRFLWSEGVDYNHGTGHGVGCFLSVHEEAARLFPGGTQKILPGMILSNEPGYYRKGAYGIRIESLVLVVETGKTFEDGRKALGFETITLAPIDRSLIETSMLEPAERAWLDAYHARVRAAYEDALDAQDGAWLLAATASL